MMRARIKSHDSADVDDLTAWRPGDPTNFGFQLHLEIGTDDLMGADMFQIVVSTPKWRAEYLGNLTDPCPQLRPMKCAGMAVSGY
jgi:hypothetical protein